MAKNKKKIRRIGFISTRLAGTDGVSLETAKWAEVLEELEYPCYYFAGELDRPPEVSMLVKEAHFAHPEIQDVYRSCFEATRRKPELTRKIHALKEDLKRLHPEISFTSQNAEMQRAVGLARQVAASESVVLLRGPSGTGKTVLARAIHGWSRRAGKPFATISCPTLSPELLESELFGHVKGAFTGALRDNAGRVAACDGGTLFLDEIGDLPFSLQPKLLRFIQDREYERVGDQHTRKADVRIITATNADLDQAVKEGRFREDLFYRLNVIQIDLPPLADRPDDVQSLANEMLVFFGAQNHKAFRGFSNKAMDALRSYAWPGNIRELRNAVERAAILCPADLVEIEHLPASIAPHIPPVQLGNPVSLEVIEENHIRRVIASTRSLQEAADILGIDQATLWRKRKQYGI